MLSRSHDNFHSEEVQEIIGKMPNGVIRYGVIIQILLINKFKIRKKKYVFLKIFLIFWGTFFVFFEHFHITKNRYF